MCVCNMKVTLFVREHKNICLGVKMNHASRSEVNLSSTCSTGLGQLNSSCGFRGKHSTFV